MGEIVKGNAGTDKKMCRQYALVLLEVGEEARNSGMTS